MAGKPGRSGGHNRVAIAEHRVRGTYRPSRHDRRTDPQPALPVPLSPAVVPLALVEGLGAAGRTFAEDVFRSYDGWATHERALLRQAARCLDDAEAAATSRGRQSAIRLFASVVAQLHLTPLQPPASANPLDKYTRRS
jgi:hypothetical protein